MESGATLELYTEPLIFDPCSWTKRMVSTQLTL